MRVVRTFAAASCALLAACASGSENNGGEVDARAPVIDAPPQEIDATVVDAPDVDAASIDATSIDATSIDATAIDAAATDAMTDAATDAAIDAGCTTMVLQRLTNPSFDLAPMGTGWVQTPYDATSPLVTDEDGIVEHTAPYKAWLAGWPVATSERLYQDVAIPAGTTQLTLRGQYSVATSETGTGTYDTCNVELLTTGGALIQNVMSLSNRTTTATWTPFTFTFTSPQAGQTVRLNFRSATDSSLSTAFWFDTLALEATVCQ